MVFSIVPIFAASGHEFAPSYSLTRLAISWVFRIIDEIELDGWTSANHDIVPCGQHFLVDLIGHSTLTFANEDVLGAIEHGQH